MPHWWVRPSPHRAALVPACLLVVLLIASPARASSPAEVVVSGGTLGLSPAPAVRDFVVVTLDGTARTTTSSMDPFLVTDARGTGAGWKVTVQASRLRQWDGAVYVAGGWSLPMGSLAMPAPSVAARGTDSAPPAVTSGPYVIDGATVTVATAGEGTGMGSYAFTPGELVLAVPARAYASTYRSEIAISITSGP